MVRQSFNPLKMFGGYFGAIIGLIIHIMINHGGNFRGLLSFGSHIIPGIFWVSVGFLIGWGIHSIIRRLR